MLLVLSHLEIQRCSHPLRDPLTSVLPDYLSHSLTRLDWLDLLAITSPLKADGFAETALGGAQSRCLLPQSP